MSRPNTCFSYRRFSTSEQQHGDSLRRQLAKAEAYCLKHKLTLDIELSFEDLGKSAYRGDNVHTGRLGAFLKAIEDELVIPGDRLLVENLDRLSRQAVRKVVEVINRIVDAGVILVTLDDQKEYSAENLDRDQMNIMMLVLSAVRANDESMRKAERLRASWSARRAKALEKPLTSRAPGWLKLNKGLGKFDILRDRAHIVKRIFEAAAAGKGLKPIAEMLNREGTPTFNGGKFWYKFYIAKILDSPAVVGTFQPHATDYKRNGNGRDTRVLRPLEPVPGYFPPIIEEELFNKVKAMRENKIPAMRGNGELSMLAGLVSCSVCGGAMNRVAKGSRGHNRYVCAKAKAGGDCKYRSVRQETLEKAITKRLPLTPKFATDVQAWRIEKLAADIKKRETAIANLVEQAAMGPSLDITLKLDALQTGKHIEENEIARLLFHSSPLAKKTISKAMGELCKLVGKWPMDSTRCNALMRQMFTKVVVDVEDEFVRLHWRGIQDAYEQVGFDNYSMATKNPTAKAVRTPRFKSKVVKAKKGRGSYTRKKKQTE